MLLYTSSVGHHQQLTIFYDSHRKNNNGKMNEIQCNANEAINHDPLADNLALKNRWQLKKALFLFRLLFVSVFIKSK